MILTPSKFKIQYHKNGLILFVGGFWRSDFAQPRCVPTIEEPTKFSCLYDFAFGFLENYLGKHSATGFDPGFRKGSAGSGTGALGSLDTSCVFTHLGRSQQQHGGPLEYLPGSGDLRPPPFVFQVVLPLARQVRQLHHFGAEVTERLDEFREIVDAFQPTQTSGHLKPN